MPESSQAIAIAFVDASRWGGKEASIYGTPTGLRKLADGFRQAAVSGCPSTRFEASLNGLLIDIGLDVELNLSNDLMAIGKSAFRNVVRFRTRKRKFYDDEEIEFVTTRVSNCFPRTDGAFAVAYPSISVDVTLVIAGNDSGILHVTDHLEGMADFEYEPYDPNWPENSEHYHSWFDGEKDVMLGCGMGMQYGRIDHRKDGSVGWMLEDRESNCIAINRMILGK